MLLLDFQSQLSVCRPEQTSRGDEVDVSLSAGGHLAFSTYGHTIEILVRNGRVWLTDGPVDHVLSGFQSHEAPTRSRVVITALTDAAITIRPTRAR